MPITQAAARAMTPQELHALLGRTTAELSVASSNVSIIVHEMGLRDQNELRPIIQDLLNTNRAEYFRLANEHNRMTQCPVCHEAVSGPNRLWDGPMNSALPTSRPHWMCTDCWQNLDDRSFGQGRAASVYCLICRDDVTGWARSRWVQRSIRKAGPEALQLRPARCS